MENATLRTHIQAVRGGRVYEWDEWMLPLLPMGLVVTLPKVGKVVIDSVELDLTEEFPIQWIGAK
jgi:hypothetical protein